MKTFRKQLLAKMLDGPRFAVKTAITVIITNNYCGQLENEVSSVRSIENPLHCGFGPAPL